MNRVLLALLVLLTGLAAQVSPASAAMCDVGEAEVGSVEAVHGAVRLARQVAISTVGESAVSVEAERGQATLPPSIGLVAETVRIGVDRSRE